MVAAVADAVTPLTTAVSCAIRPWESTGTGRANLGPFERPV
jgi:hypothetical protein